LLGTGPPNKTLQQTAATGIALPGLDVASVAAAAELGRSASGGEGMAKMNDEPLNDETMGSISGCANDALQVLGRSFMSADAATVVEAVDNFAYEWQKGNRPSTDVVEDTEQARLIFGSLWGQQLVKQFEWEWRRINFSDGSFSFGVVSPDRSLAIYPLDFILGCMQDPDVDVTVSLSFNMLLAGSVPKMKARSYTNVMEGVSRIVPRD
jgi:hypothetical protein